MIVICPGNYPSRWGYYHLPVPDLDIRQATTHWQKSKPGSRTGQEMITQTLISYHTSPKGSEPYASERPILLSKAGCVLSLSRSALLLLMTGILTNDHDAALALDDLALFAHGLYRRPDFHGFSSLLYYSQVQVTKDCGWIFRSVKEDARKRTYVVR